MRVLVACEFSGVVRNAFRALGHDAWSCDLLPAEDGSIYHLQGDAIAASSGTLEYLSDQLRGVKWDLMIAHPPCRYLNHAGVRWLYKDGRRWIRDDEGNVIGENPMDGQRWEEMRKAAAFFRLMLNADIRCIAVENSEMHPYAIDLVGCHETQQIQPWQFGHGEVKATCLWLKGLPKLIPTDIVEGREARVHNASPGPDRWKERSRTLPGIAKAMAEQWSEAILAGRKNEPFTLKAA